MSDERDETRSFSAFDDATWADDAGPGRRRSADDSTRFQPPARDDDDRTRIAPPTPDLSDDETVVDPGARPVDATSVMPPAGGMPPGGTQAGGPPAWSGRAEVRPPQPGNTDYQQVTDWPAAPGPERNDRWWMPILVGIIVLVLLAALGWGIYLIVQNAGKNSSPAPATTTSAPAVPPTAATTADTTQPTTEPTTTEPTTAPTTTDPTDDAVAIPALKGLSVADAKAALKGVGFNSTRVIYQPSDAEPDTVIDSDPKEGQEVPPDTRVTLVVSAPSTATTTATATDNVGGN